MWECVSSEAKTPALERWARSLRLLAEGRYEEGWPSYEARLESHKGPTKKTKSVRRFGVH
jgi:hypothetical protein